MSLFQKPPAPESEELTLRREIREKPKHPAIRNKLGDWYAGQGKALEAVREYRRSAEFYLQQELYSQAVAVLKKALRMTTSNMPLAELLVHACRLANRPQAAAEVYFDLSSSLTVAGDQLGAFQMFARGVAENPSNAAKKYRLAEWARNLGKTDRAADLLLDLASFWGTRLDLDRAFRYLNEARRLRNGPKAALVECHILETSGRHAEASSLAQGALARFPNNAGLQGWLASQGELDTSKAFISAIPPEAVLHRLRLNLTQAKGWLSHGYPTRAMGLIQRMLISDPGFVPAIELAKQIHQESGFLSRYQRLCRSCAERLVKQGRLVEASACLDRMETFFPGSAEAYRSSLGLIPATLSKTDSI